MSTGITTKPSSFEPSFEFPIKPALSSDIEQEEKRRELAQSNLGIDEPSVRDQEIANLIRTQISSDYVPTRMRDLRGIPDHILKSAEAINQIPRLSITDKMRSDHESWHVSQNVADMQCELCRESIRDRIKKETDKAARTPFVPPQQVVETSLSRRSVGYGEPYYFEGKRSIHIRINGLEVYIGAWGCEGFFYARWFGYQLVRGADNHHSCQNPIPENAAEIEARVREYLKKAGAI